MKVNFDESERYRQDVRLVQLRLDLVDQISPLFFRRLF